MRWISGLYRVSLPIRPPVEKIPAMTGALSIENKILFFGIYAFVLRLINTAPLELLHFGRLQADELRSTVPQLCQSDWTTILSSLNTRATCVAFTLVPVGPEDLLVFLHAILT